MSAAPLHNLPLPQASLVGRQSELRTIQHLLTESGTRLVTLTGIGGGGKTRLALEAAHRLLPNYPDGVCFVELARITDDSLVVMGIAETLGVEEASGQSIVDSLKSYLLRGRFLLILDNCEQVIYTCAELVEDLLTACPQLRVLVTSREPLEIPGERQFRILPLPVPDQRAVALDEVAHSEAVQLLVERAGGVRQDFKLTLDNAAIIGDICRRLGGIPLALELAAARANSLSLTQIRERLDDCLSLLIKGSRLAPTRQQTIRATLDWSYNLLHPLEHVVFRRLSVFANGCDLEAAEAVCAGGDANRAGVFDALDGLVDASLVNADVTGQSARYFLLEPVRQYAAGRLVEAGEVASTRSAHAHYFLDLADSAAEEIVHTNQIPWLNRLEREHDNLRGAITWAREHDQFETELRLVSGLALFWWRRGYLSEGREWLERALSRSMAVELSTGVRARATFGAGILAHRQGDFEQAKRWLTESLGFFRASHDGFGVSRAMSKLAGGAYDQGDIVSARDLWEESLMCARELGDPRAIVEPLGNLGDALFSLGDLDRAEQCIGEAIAVGEAAGRPISVAINLVNLGRVRLGSGDPASGRALYHKAFPTIIASGDRRLIAGSLEGLAAVALAGEEARRAATLLGIAQAMREAIATPRPMPEQQAMDEMIAAVKGVLGEAGWASAFASGKAMPFDDAIALALERQGPSQGAEQPKRLLTLEPGTPRHLPAGLTARELDVARLIAEGLSNPEIADRLFISSATVRVHVHHLLEKLALRSRWQIADVLTFPDPDR